MKLFNSFFKLFKSYTVIFIGASIFGFFIWVRFIRGRVPKNIPFNLSLLGFLILLGICILYFYLIYSSLYPKEQKEIFTKLINFLYTPLEEFDYFWKHISFIEKRYKNFMRYFTRNLDYLIITYPLFYIIFYILPRSILVTTLIIDIFYFHKLFYIYKILLIGVLLFLHRYIIYSIKMYKKDLIFLFKEDVESISTLYVFGVHPSEWPENYDPNDPDESEVVPADALMCLPIDIFIDYYVKEYINKNIIKYRIVWYQKGFHIKQKIRFNINLNERLPFAVMDIFAKETEAKMEEILYLTILLENYNIFTSTNEKVKEIKFYINSMYLICWSCTLYISILAINYNPWVIYPN